ncbi:BTAD domain-containing putative transcriptional regulator [Streptomyces sp. ACA25]|uniref:BTAD domain-containing putative transcriptional regulator n=1 Tax=Streptomyces sp. ACA25 TaxID=3022596 RepID=UPI0023078CDA|nr:BTAD domain-containing putative transcriptional regulator [Streptomyces sp. ACA25]MDB1089989.1 BTAD domain-containing putative transcriptional regulator [Streptomyces sp. ACA25]
MYFSVLGPLTVRTTDGVPVAVPEAKVRALLAALLVHAGQAVPSDRLVDHLWGDRLPRDPIGALQTKVSRLRRALARAETGAGTLVESRAPGYLLRAGPGDVDSRRFADLTAAAYDSADPRTRSDLLTDALALWKGDAFSDLREVEFLHSTADRLEEQRLTALEVLAEARLELSEHHTLAGELGELAVRHPLRERLRAAHIRALYQAGRQSEALAAYTGLRKLLAEELGVDPSPELAALHQAVLAHDETLRAAPGNRGRSEGGSLPAPLTALTGREDAVPAVSALLTTHRLVTLTGPGGVGKTRLAEAVAGRVADAYPDGVRMAGLAGSTKVAEQLSAVLGIREEGAGGLEDALRSRRLLLLLDNCEHVIDSAADVIRRILAAAPGLSVLATSREPIGLAGETVWAVPPLRQADAERLFAQRAAAAAPGFSVTEHNAAAVAEICRRLDRIPLALELAATRVRALGVHELSARLDDRFRLLAAGHRGAPPRQRTLRAVIDWSWELLADDERTVLRRLSVFTDGCTLEAAEAVCGNELDVLTPLIRLVDRSLVTVTDGPRYRLPESVAAYALERLAEANESEAVGRRHHSFHAGLVEQAAARLHGPAQQHWLTRLDRESANLRTALEWAVRRRDAAGAARMALASTWYWFLRGRLSEAQRSLGETLRITGDDAAGLRSRAAPWYEAFVLLAGEPSKDPALSPEESAGDRDLHARAAWFLGYASLHAGENLARSEVLVDRALTGFRSSGDRWGTAAALSTRAAQALLRGDLTTLRRSAADAHAFFEAHGDAWGELQTTYPLAALATITGDYTKAAHLHEQGLRLAEELGLWTDAADRLTGLGRVALLTGDFPRAAGLPRKAMTLAADHGYPAGEIHAEIGLALGARREGHFDLAERHLRKTLAWHREVDFGPGPALLLAELGFLAEQRGDATTALSLHRQGLSAARDSGDPRAVALAREGLAGAHALAGRPVQAARLLGMAARARTLSGAPLPQAERGDVDRTTARVLAALGNEVFTAEFSSARDAACPPGRCDGPGSDVE